MRKSFLALIGAVVIASQLSGCVVYDRPYHPYWGPHYYHGWYYH
jgi:hypothetical protein